MTKPDLRLVQAMDGGPSALRPTDRFLMRANRTSSYDPQLTLPFDDPIPAELTVAIVPMDEVHGSVLNTAIVSYKPKVVLDLRYAVRFDLYGTDRRTVFEYFSAYKTYYSVASVPWHNLTASEFMAGSSGVIPSIRHEILERNHSSIMFFVPKTEHVYMLKIYLNRLLSQYSKKTWALEQVLAE